MFSTLIIKRSAALTGDVAVPGDKSISHRALMLGAIAKGVTTVQGFLFGEDNLATLQALRQLGVEINVDETTQTITIQGVGKVGLQGSSLPLRMGNSGTAMRLMMGMLAGQSFDSVLVGDDSLTQRPMARVAEPLVTMGAKISLSENGTAPVKIYGNQPLAGITCVLPVASAQVKSALLLAGLYATGATRVTVPAVTRDHTERMLKAFGCPVEEKGLTVTLSGGAELTATKLVVPGDISSAAFFIVAGCITPGSKLVLRRVGVNPTRVGVITLLQKMGADVRLVNKTTVGGEPIADIEVNAAALHGIEIGHEEVALAIDEMPVIMVAAAHAKGVTRIRGARELRVKETDRIQAMANGLSVLGIKNKVVEDGIDIEGGTLGGGQVESFTDHRIAMAFAVAGCVAKAPITISNTENVATSFPNFVELAQHVGMDLVGS